MMHPQQRRLLATRSPDGPEAATDEPEVEAHLSTVPRQAATPGQPATRPDAYDLYAQIYALRTTAPEGGQAQD